MNYLGGKYKMNVENEYGSVEDNYATVSDDYSGIHK